MDYKAWARGLKQAGYATSPEYANALIKIIEEYGLHNMTLSLLITMVIIKRAEVR
jgi:flagellum-specific peptidoglycan hydrolase FlgJ